LLKSLDVIVIDEVSMVRADLMDGIDISLRANRNNNKPFGGVQMILVGDLNQLPPIVDKDLKNHFDQLYNSPYFFDARVFQEIKLPYINLKTVYRQQDTKFKNLLNRIRDNNNLKDTLNELNERSIKNTDNLEFDDYVFLTATNRQASEINIKKLKELKTSSKTYRAYFSGDFNNREYDKFPADINLELKKGARIMFIKNDKEKRWVNGDIGIIKKVKKDHILVKKWDEVFEVRPEKWDKIVYKYVPAKNSNEKGSIDQEIIGTFEQLPVKLAWAITIHKSQGQTFDKVMLDMGSGAFTHGQTYVALSRCRSLEGLILNKLLTPGDIILDQRIYGFERKFYPFDTELSRRFIKHVVKGGTFISTEDIITQINEIIIKGAKERIILISPFIQFSLDNHYALKEQAYKNIPITIVYGKADLKSEEEEFINSLKNSVLYYHEKLHVKIYLNENVALFTSMNLYKASSNNTELGMLFTKENNRGSYEELYQWAIGIINNSTLKTNHVKSENKKNIFKEKSSNNDLGFCIRCHQKIEPDFEGYYTMCNNCYNIWATFGNEYFEEKYCHFCGEPHNTWICSLNCVI